MSKFGSKSQSEPIDWALAVEYLGGDAETAISLLKGADSSCFNELLPKIYESIQVRDWSSVAAKTAVLRGSCRYIFQAILANSS